jgi:hypothetical protein
MILTKEQILSSTDCRMEKVSVPEWGGDVMVRTMTCRDRDLWEAETVKAHKSGDIKPDYTARFISKVVCDENGALLFSLKDIEGLAQKSGAVIQRLYKVALKLNTVTAEEIEAAGKN